MKLIPSLVIIFLAIVFISHDIEIHWGKNEKPRIVKKEKISLPGREDICLLYISETEYVIGYCDCKVGEPIKKGKYMRLRSPNMY